MEVVEKSIQLGVDKIAGLIDRDFDGLADECEAKGLPLATFLEADLEAHLVMQSEFEYLVTELASSAKLAKNGGVEELRRIAVQFAVLVGLVRRHNSMHGWGLDFAGLGLDQRIDTRTLTLKNGGFCAVAARQLGGEVSEADLLSILEGATTYPPAPGSFRGKDALIMVRVALKRIFGDRRIDDEEVLPAMIRMGADASLLKAPPFSDLADWLV